MATTVNPEQPLYVEIKVTLQVVPESAELIAGDIVTDLEKLLARKQVLGYMLAIVRSPDDEPDIASSSFVP